MESPLQMYRDHQYWNSRQVSHMGRTNCGKAAIWKNRIKMKLWEVGYEDEVGWNWLRIVTAIS
jgi:hypothetical protein